MAGQTFVIVGASLAGAKAAETLREEGFDGRVVLVGAERERPYERPPLSKDYLRREADGKPYVHEAAFYGENEIELRTSTTVAEIDAVAGEVMLANGEGLGFDRLLLAAGAEPRRLRVPGVELDGVLYLRTVEDSDAIRERIDGGGKLVTIGAGWTSNILGWKLAEAGYQVLALEQGAARWTFPDFSMDHDPEAYVIRKKMMVDITKVMAIEGDGKVAAVRLAGDKRIEADFVVVGVGVAPRIELAETAGLEIENGVACDQRLKTSAPNVFAAGDVANAFHPFYGRRLRVEHWFNALEQGPVAARNMLGRDEPYEKLPYFFSDQYEVGMEYAGFAAEWDEVVFRGDVDGREFIAFWLSGGRVVAGMNVNVWDVTDQIQALIRSRSEVDVSRLRDPDVPLEELTPGPR